MTINTMLYLEQDEAILLHALAVYATAKIKPPINPEVSLQDMMNFAEALVALAPAEVMQRLAGKLKLLGPAVVGREPVIRDWRRLQV